jgi:hypothetical protein
VLLVVVGVEAAEGRKAGCQKFLRPEGFHDEAKSD